MIRMLIVIATFAVGLIIFMYGSTDMIINGADIGGVFLMAFSIFLAFVTVRKRS